MVRATFGQLNDQSIAFWMMLCDRLGYYGDELATTVRFTIGTAKGKKDSDDESSEDK